MDVIDQFKPGSKGTDKLVVTVGHVGVDESTNFVEYCVWSFGSWESRHFEEGHPPVEFYSADAPPNKASSISEVHFNPGLFGSKVLELTANSDTRMALFEVSFELYDQSRVGVFYFVRDRFLTGCFPV